MRPALPPPGMPLLLLLVLALVLAGSGCAMLPNGMHAAVDSLSGRTAATPRQALRLARVWSSDGAAQRLSFPVALALDGQGRLIVVDGGNDRLQVFDGDGRSVQHWGSTGTGAGQFRFRRPDRCDDRDQDECTPDVGGAVAVDGQGRVYVADYGNSRVQVFDHHGTFLTGWGSEGSGPGQFLLPQGIAVDRDGHVYVSDTHNHRIQQFDLAGTFLAAWGRDRLGGDRPFRPGALAMTGQGHLLVTDPWQGRVQQCTREGQRVAAWTWETQGVNDGTSQPGAGIAVDRQGQIYVSDATSRIWKYTADGQMLTRSGQGGPGDVVLHRPTGIAVDAQGDLYVADQASHRLYRFRQVLAHR